MLIITAVVPPPVRHFIIEDLKHDMCAASRFDLEHPGNVSGLVSSQ